MTFPIATDLLDKDHVLLMGDDYDDGSFDDSDECVREQPCSTTDGTTLRAC